MRSFAASLPADKLTHLSFRGANATRNLSYRRLHAGTQIPGFARDDMGFCCILFRAYSI